MTQHAIDKIWFDRLQENMVEWRRHLHKNPEISFQESKTAAFVADKLESWGIEIRRQVGGHGVVGTIRGAKPGPVVLLRADMDALPIQDEKECEYRSSVDGAMHACGHDGHTSALLGTAYYFSLNRDELQGEIRLLFQPAEELLPGGAVSVIKDGILEGVDVIYGIHLWTPFPVGTAASCAGPLMAAADDFYIEITGKGGHGGMPQSTNDSVVAGSALVMQLQSVVSRSVDPLRPAVLTVGTIQGGSAQNVIAETCRLSGTIRTFDEETRTVMKERLHEVTELTAATYGTTAQVRYIMGYPPVVNDTHEASRFFNEAKSVFGEENVQEASKLMPAEDFAYYLERVPGCFMFVGAGNPVKGAVYPHHHPKFDFDEDAMINAVRLFIAMSMGYAAERNAGAIKG
ncbi:MULTISPECIES: M20 metallopeptidase family protein [Paenibacillus]|uniref:M20 family metallopeptidase n=1 Tax=Paenibacillus polymyxa TaxID=1406 RepID=A0AAP4A113_PAEPO|nr:MULTISPECIES: M20 family metallopeptidase [Paenibacillus]ALA42919.1 peptidase M20 [Paenibacillus peoriae]APB75286.1 amidohydrolase [Paenibacillus polymyxa]MBP1177113.1 amidohydrolase [Paenibacillus sp. PvR133]MDH2330614.1 M20 family metallopeptidase [Paenibacillus polymyxa]OMF71610.1 peptidase M20 [Paenibacillus peoriae]